MAELMSVVQAKLAAWGGDIVSAATTLAALTGLLAPVAALAGLTWYSIQIWESRTVQAWVALKRAEQKARKLARMHQNVQRACDELDRAQKRLREFNGE